MEKEFEKLESERLIMDRKIESIFEEFTHEAKQILNSEKLIKDVSYLLYVKNNLENNTKLKEQLERGKNMYNKVAPKEDYLTDASIPIVKLTLELTAQQTIKNLIFH